MATVTINLSQSLDAKEMDEESFIHQPQFRDTIKLIKDSIKKAIDNKTKKDEHIHEAITVLGTRGSGKTTFLLTVKEMIEKTEKGVKVLKIIDPTIIEDKGHIFLNIISIINDLVLDVYKDSNERPLISEKEWCDAVINLSHGLPSMDGVGGSFNEADWQDAEFIMEKGLINVSSARRLSESFQKFLQTALEILKKDVFLLLFDDIDIDFKKGWSILETIRKYLHTSKIITLVSGDLNLYKLAIRNKYWNNFGKGMMINEGDRLYRNEYFNERITELESQYLLKVVKPERRVHLTTLYEKLLINISVKDPEQEIFIQVNNGKEKIVDYYSNILEKFGVKNKYQAEAYVTFLLGLPLRTQIQFLSQFGNPFRGINKVNVTDAFLSDLIDNNVNVSLINANPQLINVEILNLLLKRKSLNDLYQLQPVTRNNGLNSCLVSLSFLASQKINSTPYLIFDYFIKIGYIRNLIGLLGYEDESGRNLNNLSPSIEGLCNHSGIFQNKVLRDIVGNITSYIKGETSKVNNWAGIISIGGFADTSKKSSNTTSDRIDVVLRKAKPDQRIVGYIPLSICSYTTINRSITCYSIYTLIATIGELIRKAEQQDLSRGLAELSEARSYGIPEFKKRINDKIDISPFLSEAEPSDPSLDFQLNKRIEEWVMKYRDLNLHISPHFLGKISTRLFYALNSIENIEDSTSLGNMMHTRVIAFMNAILIEDIRENIEIIDGFNISNTNLKETIFLNNLKSTSNYYSKLQFSQWMISCPLLLLYLDLKVPLIERLNLLLNFKEDDIHYYQNNSIFSLLQEVTAKTNKQNKNIATRGDYDKIIGILKERQIPYSWFELTGDKGLITDYNTLIKDNLSDLFGKDPSSLKLRNFRKYLNSIGEKW